ncbi:MAG: PHP domain-containing protein [Candidatus Dormibacteria bacterium]
MHTQWSWDAPDGDMAATCERALRAGLRSVAFTEHADFIERTSHPRAVVDMHGYLAEVAACRERFPGLRIRSGVELGQPHLHVADTAALLASAAAPLDCVLGSVHVAEHEGRLTDLSRARHSVSPPLWPALVRSSLAITLDLVESGAGGFEVLAHLEYAKRYWPHEVMPYDPAAFEPEYRAVLEAAAARGLVLEINSTRGAAPHRGLGPGVEVLRWWHQAGGRAVCFGSDSHDPSRVGHGLRAAADLAAQAGFHPAGGGDHWSRRAPG